MSAEPQMGISFIGIAVVGFALVLLIVGVVVAAAIASGTNRRDKDQ